MVSGLLPTTVQLGAWIKHKRLSSLQQNEGCVAEPSVDESRSSLRNFLVASQTLRNRVCQGECTLAVDFQARQFRTTVPAEGLLRSNASRDVQREFVQSK